MSVPILGALAVACQPAAIETDNEFGEAGEGLGTVVVRTEAFDFLPFDTRTSYSLADVSSRMSYALFYCSSGEKVMAAKSQTRDVAGYGTFELSLKPDRYVLVTVAHNGDGNCTITSPSEVKFSGNKVTDTFVSCDTIEVQEGLQTADIKVSRRVAMFRMQMDDVLPQDVAQLKFFYTGGSSTLDAAKGYGCVNSRQTEVLDVPAQAHEAAGSTFGVYTFPHADSGTLKMVITALDAAGSAVTELELPAVPVRIGEVTRYCGTLTAPGDTQGLRVELTVADGDWTYSDYSP